MEQTVFELDLLEEARDFLKSVSKEIRGKIGYNIRRVQKGERDNELFKKLDGTEIWEFAQSTIKLTIGYSPFGTRILIHWLLPLTAL